tara:strand:- start:45227 stop:46063 length:837 start_codon:yes stop_codon:yes gene_type:complete
MAPFILEKYVKIAVLNLMPNKIETEKQLSKALGYNNYKIDFTFLRTRSYTPKNTDLQYLKNKYKSIDEIISNNYDGFICTGAPVERLPFDSVDYLDEIKEIMNWARANILSSYYICWGANVALNHFYDIKKVVYNQKLSGVYEHDIIKHRTNLMNGLSGKVKLPVSRFSGIKKSDIELINELELLLYSKVTGSGLIANLKYSEYYNFNHFEYDAKTLADEYKRDLSNGIKIEMPTNYFPSNNPNFSPINSWKKDGTIFFNNWLKSIRRAKDKLKIEKA